MKEQNFDSEEIIRIAETIKDTHIDHEDDAIAICLNCPEERVWQLAFSRLQTKYADCARDFIEHRCPEISGTGKAMIFDIAFEKILKSRKIIKAKNGKLGSFVCLMCFWGIQRVNRLEKRRRALLKKNFQELWCIRQEEANGFRRDAVTEKRVEDLLSIIQQIITPLLPNRTRLVMQAICAIYLNTNGWQVKNYNPNPSIAGIKKYLADQGHPMSEGEISKYREILREMVKSVLEEQGWELNQISKC